MEALTPRTEAPRGPLPWMIDDCAVANSDWRHALPVLTSPGATVRNLRLEDAASLLAMLSTEEVTRFISPPPTTVDAFEQFIKWALQQQALGRYACFAIVPVGSDRAVGLIQFRNLGDNFSRAEWGFAVGSAYWGTGLFMSAAQLVLEFAFSTIGVERLEARCVVENGRGTGALRKLGAVPKQRIADGLVLGTKTFDQYLWTLDRDGYQSAPAHHPHVTQTVH
jgi:ribosomal-protein-alanine N-acetyltransferase